MNPSYDLTGSQVRQAREYPIATNTSIQNGQAVTLTNALVTSASVSSSGPILGVAAETHLGMNDSMNLRSNGRVIKIYDSPTQVYTCRVPEYTATAGTANTITCGAASDSLRNGFVKLVDKENGSTNEDVLGTVYTITGSTTAGVITIDRPSLSPTNINAGDVFEIYPPVGYNKSRLRSGGAHINLDSMVTDSPITIAGSVISMGLAELTIRNIYT